MTQTVKDATEQQQSGALAVIEEHRRDLAAVMPSHVAPATWVRVAMGAVRKSTDLWKACNETPGSMMNALMEAARLGLEPGTDEYYLTPRKNKSGRWEVVGIVGYMGEIELIYRAGAVASVICYDVREGDHFEWRPGKMDRPAHEPKAGAHAWFSGRGEVLGCYAYAIMRDTGAVSEVVIVDDKRIQRALEASGTANASHSPWKSDYRAMVLKTGAHDLSKWVPTSAEYRREQLRASASVAAEINAGQRPPEPAAPAPGRFVPPPEPDVIDGEVVAEPPAQRSEPQPEKKDTNRLFALLRDGAVSSRDKDLRLRIVARILNWPPADPLTSFDQLRAAHVATVNSFLQRHKDVGDLTHTLAELGAVAPAEPAHDTPAEQPEQQPADAAGGDQ